MNRDSHSFRSGERVAVPPKESEMNGSVFGMDGPKERLFIAVPSGPMIHARFMESLFGVMIHEMSRGVGVMYHNMRGSILPNLRQRMYNAAEAGGFTHLLFVDSDMHFPKDTAERLMEHKRAVVACACPTKEIPSCTTAYLGPKEPLFIEPRSYGLQKVWRVGCGVMLIRLGNFAGTPSPKFPMIWSEENNHFYGEDWGFCRFCEERDIPIFVDKGLSKKIEHLGEVGYHHSMVDREAQMAQLAKASDTVGTDGELVVEAAN